MQLVSIAIALVACASSAASASVVLPTPIKLPLRWLDQRAYVTSISINGVSTTLEVTTTSSDVWLACSRMALDASYAETCEMEECPAIISRDAVNTCTAQTQATLLIPEASLELDNFPVDVVLDKQNTTMITAAAGQLGLGLRSGLFGSMHPELLSNTTLATSIQNFSLFLTDDADGSESFVQLGGSFPDQLNGFDAQELSDRQLSTRFSLPLRVDENVGLSGWDLSLTAVRFGSDQLLYPRVYSSAELVGTDAVASISLSDLIIKMPPSVFEFFRGKFLRLGCIVRDDGSECDLSVFASLPRITLHVHDRMFYLEPSDYTTPTSSRLQLRVLIGASSSEPQWLLGSPFIRKFPSMFSLQERCIDVLCEFNVSCDSRAPGSTEEPQYLPTSQSEAATPTPSFSTVAPSLSPVRSHAVIMWMGFSFGTIGLFLAASSAIKKWRHRNDAAINSTDTVISDKDLEEIEVAAGEMSSSSESRRGQHSSFTPLASPLTTTG